MTPPPVRSDPLHGSVATGDRTSGGVKICLIIQARMMSERLPGKVLMEIAGKPLLEHVIQRARRISSFAGASEGVIETVVATTRNEADEPIARLCGRMGVLCYRGSEEDVLGRYREAAAWRGADVIVRVCGDSPLTDPEVAGKILKFYLANPASYDYVSNTLKRTYPRGLDCEVFSFRVLQEAFVEARDPAEREHVTPFIYRRPERYRLGHVLLGWDESRHRWTVDTEEDFNLVEKILGELVFLKPDFSMRDTLDLLKRHPEWTEINARVEQRPV